jgi:hypothetical protein
MKAPTWSRVLCHFSRQLSAVDAAQQIVRDELLFAFVKPRERPALTFEAYGRSRNYIRGGVHATGLFPWEAALLDDSRIPRSGRVLLAAAGGGRELEVLMQRGYEVYAFEPVLRAFQNARDIARGSDAVVAQATYDDLVARATGRPGPLDDWRGPFDFCFLGWASLSHLTQPSDALDVLLAMRTLAPNAPVMTSFFTRHAGPSLRGGGARELRRVLRRVLAAIGGSSVEEGLQFYTGEGFLYSFTQQEFFDLCDQAGYEVGFFSDVDCPRALLLPKG